MDLTFIKKLNNNNIYLNQDTLELIIEKKYPKTSINILNQLSKISDEYNIPKILKIVENDDKIVSFEQFIQGETLTNFLEKGNFITFETFKNFALQLVKIIEGLHKYSIIHKDIKPDNIIKQGSCLYLIDFNISRLYDASKNNDTTLFGTKDYASPEQYGYAQTTVKSDVYSLGKTFSDLLTITVTNNDEYTFITNLIEKMTTIDPANRPTISNIQDILWNQSENHPSDTQVSNDDIFYGYIKSNNFLSSIVFTLFYLLVTRIVYDTYLIEIGNNKGLGYLAIFLAYYTGTISVNWFKMNYKVKILKNTHNKILEIFIHISFELFNFLLFSFISVLIFNIIFH